MAAVISGPPHQQADELSLPTHAILLEDVAQMPSHGRGRDAEAISGSLMPVPFENLLCDGGLRLRQSEPAAQMVFCFVRRQVEC